MNEILEAKGLSKRFGDRIALDDVSLRVSAGEFVAVLGASGSGKTTLFRCLARLTELDAGEVRIMGQPIHALTGKDLSDVRRNIAVVFQQFNLVRRLSAIENVLAGRLASIPLWRVMLRHHSAADLAKSAKALATVGMGGSFERQRADTLSGGQQQRVAIARAMVQESAVILADEPVASLDPDTAIAILDLLRNLTKTSGIAVVCSLHQPLLADRFADRTLIMTDGRLAKYGRASASSG